MSYIIGQYNHTRNSEGDNAYINLITSGEALRRKGQTDSESSSSSFSSFDDECLKVSQFTHSEYYYFRCYVKRMSTQQVFNIKLVNYTHPTEITEEVEQYLKTVTIQGGNADEWVSVECIFNPVIQFDTILFELQRGLEDYRLGARYPLIAYQELGTINNIINTQIRSGSALLKIGVQSCPNLKMCINGEEIYSPRSGIYELRNGIIPISFFSVVNAAQENTSTMEDWMAEKGAQALQIEENVEAGIITREEANELYKEMRSSCFLNTSKSTIIDSFILDYMYEE